MTICIGWIRNRKGKQEVCLASDSCFTGDQKFLAAPKIFPLERGDAAIACAGSTQYSFPIAWHIIQSINLNFRVQTRALDISDLAHTIVKIINRTLLEEREEQYGCEGPNFSLILAGFSWKLKRPYLKIIGYHKKLRRMLLIRPPKLNGNELAIIGDKKDREVHKKIKDKIDGLCEDGKCCLNMEPLEVIIDYINDKSIRSIDGRPQMLKIFPFFQILPIGFLKNNEISVFGRPLLKYETFPYPIYDLDIGKVTYMKDISPDFNLTSEKIEKLNKFKLLDS